MPEKTGQKPPGVTPLVIAQEKNRSLQSENSEEVI
jgi:hypothetical protein